jgi:hypothetical protein
LDDPPLESLEDNIPLTVASPHQQETTSSLDDDASTSDDAEELPMVDLTDDGGMQYFCRFIRSFAEFATVICFIAF